jgi:arsenate reductase-like glutaredoxin family protein
MRDGKLYKELGYKSFEEYCEAETGIKRRQVYNYIAIAEKLPAEFVQSTAQIGSEKLRLLTTLTDDQREEIAENTDLEQTSVKELQRKSKELTTDVEDLTIENDRLEKENQSLTFDNTNLEEERDDLIRQNNELMTRQPIVTGGIVTGGYDPEQLKEFFEDYYEAAHKAVRAVYIFVREDYPQEIKNYVRNRVNDLRNYIEDLEDIHEDDF